MLDSEEDESKNFDHFGNPFLLDVHGDEGFRWMVGARVLMIFGGFSMSSSSQLVVSSGGLGDGLRLLVLIAGMGWVWAFPLPVIWLHAFLANGVGNSICQVSALVEGESLVGFAFAFAPTLPFVEGRGHRPKATRSCLVTDLLSSLLVGGEA